MNPRTRSLIEIHFAVFLFGFTGLFGKAISVPAQYITLGRVFFGAVAMGILFLISKKNIRLDGWREYVAMLFLGALLAVTWTSFYRSVQVSTVTIALLAFSSFPITVTFIEPLMFREKLKKKDIACSVIMFLGVLLIVPEYNLGNNLTIGLLWGLLCANSFAFLSIFNRKYTSKYDGQTITFYEQGAAALVLMPVLFIFDLPAATTKDIGLIVLLGVVFTALAYSLFVRGMKNVRAQTAGVIASLETVYGIIFAAILLGEIPSLREIAGAVVMLGTAFCSTMISAKEGK